MLKRSPSDTFVKGALGAFEDDAKFGRTPADQEVEDRHFHFASYLDAEVAATRAAEAAARSRQPHANKDKSTPKDTSRAAEDSKQGPPKDQRTGRAAENTKSGQPKAQGPTPG